MFCFVSSTVASKMASAAERLFIYFKTPKALRRPKPYYTPDDYSKETLDKWALDNGRTKQQVYRRRYNIKKHIRIRDSKLPLPQGEETSEPTVASPPAVSLSTEQHQEEPPVVQEAPTVVQDETRLHKQQGTKKGARKPKQDTQTKGGRAPSKKRRPQKV